MEGDSRRSSSKEGEGRRHASHRLTRSVDYLIPLARDSTDVGGIKGRRMVELG